MSAAHELPFQPAHLVARSIATRPHAVEHDLRLREGRDNVLRPRRTQPRIAVVGAGVVGLSIAAELRRLGLEHVTLYQDRSPTELASYAAAGLIEPIAGTADADGARLELEAFGRSYRAWATATATQQRPVVLLRRVRTFVHRGRDAPSWGDLVDAFRPLEHDELPPGYEDASGFEFITFVVDTHQWMESTMDKLVSEGVEIKSIALESPDDVPDVDVVVNATGIWAHSFVDDPSLYRGDGHVVYVERPDGLHDVFMDERRNDAEVEADPLGVNMIYVIPRRDDVVLGGTLFNRLNPSVVPTTEVGMDDRILKLAQQVEPRIAGARVLDYRVCARPRRRSGTRLEFDEHSFRTPVLHCYGTGGSGWTIAPGLAQMAVETLAEAVWLNIRRA